MLLAYHWGIIAGQKNGAYSKDRSFKGSSKLTKTEWKEIKKRVEQPKTVKVKLGRTTLPHDKASGKQ